jgi:hypothetical protein
LRSYAVSIVLTCSCRHRRWHKNRRW